TYSYIFDWKSPLLGGALGACHTIELPFVFGTYAAPGLSMLVGEGPEVEELSRKTQDAWLAFARHGDPSNESLGRWPAFDPQSRHVMVLSARAHVEQHPWEAERRAWDGIL
ncbi:MAG TPA: carboxylesterase family protein, partial [Dehalococcoidia bacterium]|nr:carboxylesterase family protein [Dehalococcoidia bacterium]